jgi:hypothetical protein
VPGVAVPPAMVPTLTVTTLPLATDRLALMGMVVTPLLPSLTDENSMLTSGTASSSTIVRTDSLCPPSCAPPCGSESFSLIVSFSSSEGSFVIGTVSRPPPS